MAIAKSRRNKLLINPMKLLNKIYGFVYVAPHSKSSPGKNLRAALAVVAFNAGFHPALRTFNPCRGCNF
jgi:hypothetical protein